MRHAEVKIDGMRIPLIGVDVSATLQKCDCCSADIAIGDAIVCFNNDVVCKKCFESFFAEDGKESQ